MDKYVQITVDKGESSIEWPDKIIVTQNKIRNEHDTYSETREYTIPKEALSMITFRDDSIIGHATCSNCHKIIERDSNFCIYCGAKIVGYKFPSNRNMNVTKNESTSNIQKGD